MWLNQQLMFGLILRFGRRRAESSTTDLPAPEFYSSAQCQDNQDRPDTRLLFFICLESSTQTNQLDSASFTDRFKGLGSAFLLRLGRQRGAFGDKQSYRNSGPLRDRAVEPTRRLGDGPR